MDALMMAKGDTTVSVVLPARDEESTVGDIVAAIRRDLVERTPLVDEVLVVDSNSIDATAQRAREAGARVVAQGEVLSTSHPSQARARLCGKGLPPPRGTSSSTSTATCAASARTTCRAWSAPCWSTPTPTSSRQPTNGPTSARTASPSRAAAGA
ncbi:glycosyltransferase [Nonomuraea thailandensis]